jgi:hypothetical protein
MDDEKRASQCTDPTLPEVYKTRLLRVDLGGRSRTDHFQRWLHKQFRAFRYWRISNKCKNTLENWPIGGHWSHQNTVLIANFVARVIFVMVTDALLIIPLAVLSTSVNATQLIVVSVCFCFFLCCGLYDEDLKL